MSCSDLSLSGPQIFPFMNMTKIYNFNFFFDFDRL